MKFLINLKIYEIDFKKSQINIPKKIVLFYFIFYIFWLYFLIKISIRPPIF